MSDSTLRDVIQSMRRGTELGLPASEVNKLLEGMGSLSITSIQNTPERALVALIETMCKGRNSLLNAGAAAAMLRRLCNQYARGGRRAVSSRSDRHGVPRA